MFKYQIRKEKVMEKKLPGILRMIRAQFLIGILIPLIAGTLLAVSITGSFHPINFILLLIIGLGLHIATNVYNDIYDSIQGADTNVKNTRNTYSGGSGFLLQSPQLIPTMYRLARSGILISFLATLGLLFFVDRQFWLYLLAIYASCAFLSKYYTAAPFKFGYRGFGEILVWFSFGPLPIILATISQNVLSFHLMILAVMPVTGLSTLSILLFGQLVDLPDDETAGKRGLAAHLGTTKARYGYLCIHLLVLINILILAGFVFHPGWPLLFSLLPYAVLFPRIWKNVYNYHDQPQKLSPTSRSNALLYALFSLLFLCGLGLILLIQ